MEFGGRTKTAATAGPHRPSDGKLGGLLRPTATLYGEAEVTESSGSVSMTKGEAVSRLALRLSPMPNCVGRISVTSVGLEKASLSGREALAGDRREIDAHCVGQVKTER